jgi:hypothetical protein
MLWVISNWKVILAVVCTAVLGYLLHAVDVARLEAKQRAAITDQVATDTKSCNEAKKITEDVSNDYRQKSETLATQLADAVSLRKSQCVIVSTTGSSCRNNGTAQTGKPTSQDGVTATALLNLAAEGEGYRLQLSACQDFITKTWNLNNQGENQ